MLDADRQDSLLNWHRDRMTAGRGSDARIQVEDASQLRDADIGAAIARAREAAQLVIVDAEGTSNFKTAYAGMDSDFVVVRQRLDAKPNPASRLQELVAATPKPKAAVNPPPEQARGEPPANYFHQVVEATVVTPKRSPKKGPTRSQHVTMRLSAPERERDSSGGAMKEASA